MNKLLTLILALLQLFFVVYPVGGFSVASEGSRKNPFNELHSEILYSILNLRFDEAKNLLELSVEADSRDPAWYYLQNYLEFLNAMISGDKGSYEAYLENSGGRIDSILVDGGDDQGFAGDAAVHLTSIHLQSSFLSAWHGENFLAARHFYKAHRFLLQSEETDAGSGLVLRNRGLIALGLGSVPEEYRWLLKIFGMKGEISEGLKFLEEYLAMAAGPSRFEACLLHRFVARLVNPGLGDRELFGVSGFSGDCSSDSLTLSRYSMALIDLASGNSKKVVEKLRNYQQAKEERAFPYFNLILGEAMLNGLEQDANKPFERFLGENSGENYRHFAYHKLSWHYLLSGDRELYEWARQQVLESGEANLDADRQALSESLDTLAVNTGLLKARLLFDGGYYREALAELKDSSGIVLWNRRDSVECKYRLGRVCDRLGEKETAVVYYKEVIASGSGEKWYFAPNAALQSGIIHETGGDTELALEYYRECLKINKSAYQKSIDYKARQGIRRLEN